jgi:hypothetical protein
MLEIRNPDAWSGASRCCVGRDVYAGEVVTLPGRFGYWPT